MRTRRQRPVVITERAREATVAGRDGNLRLGEGDGGERAEGSEGGEGAHGVCEVRWDGAEGTGGGVGARERKGKGKEVARGNERKVEGEERGLREAERANELGPQRRVRRRRKPEPLRCDGRSELYDRSIIVRASTHPREPRNRSRAPSFQLAQQPEAWERGGVVAGEGRTRIYSDPESFEG